MIAPDFYHNLTYSELKEIIDQVEIEIISRRGKLDGQRAGAWVIDGNTHRETIWALHDGIENGDPAILDTLPSPRLGGEFADDPTWEDIINDELSREPDIDGEMELLSVYDAAFHMAMIDEVTRACKVQLDG